MSGFSIGHDYLLIPALQKMKTYRTKYFTHFDKRISFESVKDKIQNPEWIAQHGFYPFLHYEIVFNKYNRKSKMKKKKIRKIYYASHIDGYIYSYYGDKINESYNNITQIRNIDNVSIAYRNNKKGKSNIHFATEVIDFLSKQDKAYVFVADFTDFFDNLNHNYMKDKLKTVIGQKSLPEDYYNVFKNITKFSYFMKKDVEQYLIDNKEDTYFNKRVQYLDSSQYKKFKYKNINKNQKPYGIPQGSGISAVLSNVYLIDYDEEINEYVNKRNGIYRRYCDDIIIVIPISEEDEIQYNSYNSDILNISGKIPNLKIQKEKTSYFLYQDKSISEIDGNQKHIDYLGFRFDGKHIYLREKSLFKFYTRAYKKVKVINELSKAFNRKVKRRELYKMYTHLGRNHVNPRNEKIKGNFITYAERAHSELESIGNVNVMVKRQIKGHWKKIQKRLQQ